MMVTMMMVSIAGKVAKNASLREREREVFSLLSQLLVSWFEAVRVYVVQFFHWLGTCVTMPLLDMV